MILKINKNFKIQSKTFLEHKVSLYFKSEKKREVNELISLLYNLLKLHTNARQVGSRRYYANCWARYTYLGRGFESCQYRVNRIAGAGGTRYKVVCWQVYEKLITIDPEVTRKCRFNAWNFLRWLPFPGRVDRLKSVTGSPLTQWALSRRRLQQRIEHCDSYAVFF